MELQSLSIAALCFFLGTTQIIDFLSIIARKASWSAYFSAIAFFVFIPPTINFVSLIEDVKLLASIPKLASASNADGLGWRMYKYQLVL